MKLPQLYQMSSVENIKCWRIETNGAEIIVTFGIQGGKEQVSRDTIKVGKNIGKANETTPAQQAELEARATWEKKIKKGYVEELNRAEARKDNAAVGSWLPMLAHKFSEQGDKITYPAYCQPKLDGHRCVVDHEGNLWSRARKPINSMPHIQAAIKEGFKSDLALPLLDGELYNHDLRNNFEEISHLVKQPQAEEGYDVVQYYIYDIDIPDSSFEDRYRWLKYHFPKSNSLVLVETIEVNNEEELMAAFEHYKALGYEGAMVRNAGAFYEHKRSYNLQKIKTFDDSEFKIIGVKEGRGRLQGSAIFTCETEEGTAFDVKLRGPISELKKIFENESTWKNKQLTVQYQGITNKNKLPRFPIGLRIRNEE